MLSAIKHRPGEEVCAAGGDPCMILGGCAMKNWVLRCAVASAAVLTVGLAGCSGGPAASVDPLETQVQLAAGDSDPRDVEDITNAAQGDLVSTDDAGLAEVVFPDASFMRVGPSSEIVITELGSAEAQRTSIALDIGQTWHNVQELVADEAVYEVVTPVAVASVRGTVFSVVCVEGPSCEFTVFDGEVEIDSDDGSFTLTPYQRVVIPSEGGPATVPVDALPGWVTENIERDAEREDAAALANPPVAAAALTGEWDFVATLTATESSSPLGSTANRVWTFAEPDCVDGTCTIAFESDSGISESMTRTGDSVTGTWEGPPDDCVNGDTGEVVVPAAYTTTIAYQLLVTAAEVRDGVWTATQLTGEFTDTATINAAGLAGCFNLTAGDEEIQNRFSVELTR